MKSAKPGKADDQRMGALPLSEAKSQDVRSLAELQLALRQFVTARDWSKFHSPKNLAMALVGEAGELAAEFQWLSQVESANLPPEKLDQVRLEMADVLIYLARMADELDIDLLAAAADKIAINEGRYPAELVKGKAAKYSEYNKARRDAGNDSDES